VTSPSQSPTEILEIWAAMEEAIRQYTAERRRRVASFCERHHSWRGMWKIHAESVKEEFVTNPLNLLWAIPYALLKSAGEWIRRMGWLAPSEWIKTVPAKLKTGSHCDARIGGSRLCLIASMVGPVRRGPRIRPLQWGPGVCEWVGFAHALHSADKALSRAQIHDLSALFR
jgi:hypothetical protein